MAVTQAGEKEYRCFPGFVEVNLAISEKFTIVARPDKKRHLLRAAVLLFGFLFCGLIWRSLKVFAKLAEAAWLAVDGISVGIKIRGRRRARR